MTVNFTTKALVKGALFLCAHFKLNKKEGNILSYFLVEGSSNTTTGKSTILLF